MFFALSKVIIIFLSPSLWIIALLVWRFNTKNTGRKKKLGITIAALILVFGNELLYNKLVNAWQTQPVVLGNNAHFSAGIVLGGLGSFDKYNRGFLNGSSDRLIEICALYHQKKIRKLVISGGNAYEDNRPKEAIFLRQKALELAVSDTDIIIETESRSTFENALFTKKILDSLQVKPPYVLVTSALHMPRALQTFAKSGLTVVPYPANFTVWEKKINWTSLFVPNLGTLNSWTDFLKEVIGLQAYRLFNRA